jgi:chemotaxis protein methyltransferase CheR
MRDELCVAFLQWALPHMQLRWPGFRRVRGQVCKRLQRRIRQLGLDGEGNYRRYLAQHAEEWQALDTLTRVTISRFYRDKMMFAYLAQVVLPALAQQALARGGNCLKVWSAGAGAGEEPYSVALLWRLQLKAAFPDLRLHIVATDADARQCRRAQRACYAYGSIKNLPAGWRDIAFAGQLRPQRYCLKAAYRCDTEFRVQDIRESMPAETFDLVLCRNLVFTYFDEPLQRVLLGRIKGLMQAGGALVIGIHEQLPDGIAGFTAWSERLRIYRLEHGPH